MIEISKILILHHLHADFPGVLKVWQENVESSSEWSIKHSENNISVAQNPSHFLQSAPPIGRL